MEIGIFGKKNIQLEILLSGPHTAVTYTLERVYEKPLENNNHATERDRMIRNQQLKVTWQKRSKKLMKSAFCAAVNLGSIAIKRQPHSSTSLLGQRVAWYSSKTTAFPQWKRVNERTLARDGGMIHKNTEHNLLPFCFLMLKTAKRRTCVKFPWETHRTVKKL